MSSITKDFLDYELAGPGEIWARIPPDCRTNLIYIAENILQPARDILDQPIHISSGYRSRKHNEAVAGASSSQHLFGKAVDIYCACKTGTELFEFILVHFSSRIGGIGLYSQENLYGKFIHLDIRPKINGAITSWYFNGQDYVSPGPKMREIFAKHNLKFVG